MGEEREKCIIQPEVSLSKLSFKPLIILKDFSFDRFFHVGYSLILTLLLGVRTFLTHYLFPKVSLTNVPFLELILYFLNLKLNMSLECF